MEPVDESTQEPWESDAILSAGELERIANPLSVVHGYTQLLQRRLRRGQEIDNEELLRVLDRIDESNQLMRSLLAVLVARRRSHNEKDGPD